MRPTALKVNGLRDLLLPQQQFAQRVCGARISGLCRFLKPLCRRFSVNRYAKPVLRCLSRLVCRDGLPVQLISQPSLQRAEHPPAEALPRQSVQFHHAGLDALLQTDALIQVTGLPAVISRAVFAAHIVGTVAKAAADASASARMMTRWRHHLHLCGEQGCELHKVSRQANQTPFLKIKKGRSLIAKTPAHAILLLHCLFL